MIRKLSHIQVPVLLNYIEFDRVKNPAPIIPYFQMETVDSMVEKIKIEGLKTPLTLAVWKNKCLLTDGNHRIAALSKLNREYASCYLEIYESDEEVVKDLPKSTRERFKPIGSDIQNLINAFRK